ncbi:MAG TPA: M28 family peptidase [Steroidobacteraceae bacterium]|nr:M28 family peptidase [Steroidobacteraceae bacterium]
MCKFAPVVMLLCAAAAWAGEPRFEDANIRTTIRTLSSDEFGGRAPASPGERLTTDYIAGLFERYGLQPANGASYLQEVPLMRIAAAPDAVLAVHGGAAPLDLVYGRDIIVTSPRPQARVSLMDSPLVFAGYGIVAPEYGWNDYAGLDVRGRTVVVLVNDPGSADPALFQGRNMTYYGRWTYKYEEAARQGAAGVLIVHDTAPAGYPWEVVRNSFSGAQEKLLPDGSYQPAVEGWITHAAAERLFAAAGKSLDTLTRAAGRRGFRPLTLGLTAAVTLHDEVSEVRSHNVVAQVRGRRHPLQVVIYSAHWDHFGTKPGPDGKPQIFHGAVDNASGVAALLELARVFAQQRPAPARSVLFIATTSEEQGLLGAGYYATHPLFPLADTVADLNMDIMNVYGATRDLTLAGQFMSGLDDDVKAAARAEGLMLLPDAEPEKGHYFRADHFQFARAGVPALTLGNGTDYVGRPAGWGLAQRQAYTAQRYHKPADVYEADWDLAGMRQQLQVLYLAGRRLADGGEWPAWKPGPFRAARAAQRRASQ